MKETKWACVLCFYIWVQSSNAQVIPPYWSSTGDDSLSYLKEKSIRKEIDSIQNLAIKLSLEWDYEHEDGAKEKLRLPHSVLRPNTKLVYEAVLETSSDYLRISADDGARLFVNGEFIAQDPFGFHKLTDNKSSLSLRIEVLNNAMYGGLQSISAYSERDYKALIDLKQKSYDLRGAFPEFEEKKLKKNNIERLAIWGDSQGGWDTFFHIATLIQKEKPDLYIGLGDLVSHGLESSEWYNLHHCLRQIEAPGILVPGNHDYDGYADELIPFNYKKYVGLQKQDPTYFSYYTSNAAFIALDPNKNFPLSIDAEQQQWFLQEISSWNWKKAQWHFVLTHQPPFGQGWPGYHGEAFLVELIEKYAESANIDFFLSGHVHDYERITHRYGKQRTHFIVTGGGGGSLEPASDSEYPIMDILKKQHHYVILDLSDHLARLITKDTSGRIIDEYKFEK